MKTNRMDLLSKRIVGLMVDIFLVLSFGLQACGQSSSKPSGLSNDTVAVVNGIPISRQEYDLTVGQFESMDPEHFKNMSSENKRELLSKIMDQLITIKLMLQEAQRHGIEVSDELVEQEYEAFKSTFPSEKEFLDALQKAKTSPVIWKKGMYEALVMRKLEEAMANQLVISEEEIQHYWNENQQTLQKDIIHARQILVRTEAEAKRVLVDLQGGASFQAVIKQYSVDPLTKTKGGDLGWISRGEAFEEFEQAVFSLKPQEISLPIKGKYGYHIVQVLEKKKAKDASLNDYREKIRGLIRQQKWQFERNAWLENLKAEATIRRSGAA